MKKKDKIAVGEKTLSELSKQLGQLRTEFQKAQLEVAAGKLKNTAKPGQLRKEIAQVLTVIGQKKFLQAEGGEK